MKIRKAVFPVAGWGTRFLPATKAQPKEMLPVVDKPIIQYAVEEAVAAGIDQIIMVTAYGKRAIEDHFDSNAELERLLERKGAHDMLAAVRSVSDMAEFCYVRQREQRGLGHAVLITRELVGDEPFAVFLPDDMILCRNGSPGCMQQMIAVYERFRASVLAVERVPRERVAQYGVVDAKPLEDGIYRVADMVEKPSPDEAPSDLRIVGRYILTPEIFDALERTTEGRGGEIQLTDGLRWLLQRQAVYAYLFDGESYDAGSKLGFLVATVQFALQRPDLADDFAEYLRNVQLSLDQPTPHPVDVDT